MVDKSDCTWAEANFLLENCKWNSAANRLYYAVFQAVYGYALRKELIDADCESSLHSQAGKVVRRHTKRYVSVFTTLKQMRVRADYKTEDVDASEISENLLRLANSLRQYYINYGL